MSLFSHKMPQLINVTLFVLLNKLLDWVTAEMLNKIILIVAFFTSLELLGNNKWYTAESYPGNVEVDLYVTYSTDGTFRYFFQ